MCGIFGAISDHKIQEKELNLLGRHAEQRGKDSSGLVWIQEEGYQAYRANFAISSLLKRVKPYDSPLVLGHSRLITNGLNDNQPIIRDGICVLHNGIIVNEPEVWGKLEVERKQQIDTEIIAAIAEEVLLNEGKPETIPDKVLSLCEGVIACAIVLKQHGKLLLFSNNGSLYSGKASDGSILFSSEEFPLKILACSEIQQLVGEAVKIVDIPMIEDDFRVQEDEIRKENLIPEFVFNNKEKDLLLYPSPKLKRCTKCILPETMPFIHFDQEGVCNYCNNYKTRNTPKPKEEFFELVAKYRRNGTADCIVPFSGGRDSCYGLHLIYHELKMKPITYTYDWGMVTDLGRRNIRLMCSRLGVENIIVAADISKKRKNIAMNLKAWLKSPHLGMISILTAGDKHFFKYVEQIKKQTGVQLNLWGVNPLEVTHFKAGFLGIKPDFEEKRVYTHGAMKQLRYQFLRFKAMCKSFGYFNSSIWDTLSGEYYRSFTEKKDYFHIFDYWRWDEKTVDDTLAEYDWEKAIDTNCTWRIGDGTAAFYNYIYYLVAGFTEHDTFRSNQIREGQLSREKALKLVEDENQPRYQNIRWYLDTIGFDFKETIKVINNIPRLYKTS